MLGIGTVEPVAQEKHSLACQRHDDIDPADLSPSVSLTEVTRLFIKMEIEPCYSHVHKQTLGTQINSSKNKCTHTGECLNKVCSLTVKLVNRYMIQ